MGKWWTNLSEEEKRERKQQQELRNIWYGIKTRCTNPNAETWTDYGARGIGLDPRWESFCQFWLDMGPRPSPAHSIGRINNDKGYSPENCRWELPYEQMQNTRLWRNNTSGVRGVNWDKSRNRWEATGMLRGKKVVLYKGPDFEQAVRARKQWEHTR